MTSDMQVVRFLLRHSEGILGIVEQFGTFGGLKSIEQTTANLGSFTQAPRLHLAFQSAR